MSNSFGGAVRLTIETDKCRRERILSAQRLRGGSLRFATNAPGERFRFLLDSVDGAAFSFSAGLELEVELDEALRTQAVVEPQEDNQVQAAVEEVMEQMEQVEQ